MTTHSVKLQDRVTDDMYGDLEEYHKKLQELHYPNKEPNSDELFRAFRGHYEDECSKIFTKQFGFPVTIELYDFFQYPADLLAVGFVCSCGDSDCEKAEELQWLYDHGDDSVWVEALVAMAKSLGLD